MSALESLGGGVGGVALGIAGSAAAVAWVPGPGWVVGGSAIVAGAAVGTVGYIGGRAATRVILEIAAPEMVQRQEQERVAAVQKTIEQRLAAATQWPR